MNVPKNVTGNFLSPKNDQHRTTSVNNQGKGHEISGTTHQRKCVKTNKNNLDFETGTQRGKGREL